MQKPCPEETAGFLSRITFVWFDPMIYRSFKKPLATEDLWDMNPEDCSRELVPKFDRYWRQSLEKAQKYILYFLFSVLHKQHFPGNISRIIKNNFSNFLFFITK